MCPCPPDGVAQERLDPGSEGAGTPETAQDDSAAEPEEDFSDERHDLAMVIHDGGCQCRGHTLGWTIRSRDSLQLADAVLAAGFRREAEDPEQPELITMPVFKGCTNTNPDYCACNEGPVCCAACGEEIDEGAQAYAARFPLYQWMPPDAPGQEWEDQLWHTNCDLRGAALRGGEQ